VEVDALRREVQTLFQQKLKQVHSWPCTLNWSPAPAIC
jgi:hypothetical protein